MQKLVLLSVFIFLMFGLSQAQWNVYDCSVLPEEADTAWYEGGDSPDDIAGILSVIDDIDIPGNKLIKVDEKQGIVKEVWKMDWNADSNIGATLVFRCKGIDASTYDRDFDLYIHNGVVRERLVSNGGKEIKFDKSKVAAAMNTLVWHIYRVTIIGDYFEVFVDEDPLSYLGAQGEAVSATDNNFMFGDNGSSKIGSLYDWIIWDVSGAYAPGEGTVFPDTLTGIPTGLTETLLTNPNVFSLSQNYPNPFNPTTEIMFEIGTATIVKLKIYDINGRLVQALVNETKLPGNYRLHWNGRDASQHTLPAGIYLYALEAGSYQSVKKMTLLK